MKSAIIFLALFFASCHSIHLSFENKFNSKIRISDESVIKNAASMFYGIGAISGGGATSKLLQNYPQNQRDQILDYLFLPNFGASLHMLKVEIGGDSQSTEGTEASHMHHSWDLNYNRGYEWWLMKEAKKRNPNITLYGLPWAFPGWVGNGTSSPYNYPSLTAKYVLKWVQGAKDYHNLTIDYLGIWNERAYDVEYVRLLRAVLDHAGFKNIRLVVGDGDWGPAHDVLNDPQFAAATFALGAHYPGTLSSDEAKRTGKPLWASEDFSTFNDDIGSGCWARILNRNFVDGGMTSSIAWNLVAAYYDNLPFPRCSLMTANEPWSGHYEVTGPLWMTAHTSQFALPGWYYLPVGGGSGRLPSGGSYVGLTDSNTKQLTIIFETMSHDHSECIRPSLPPYTVKPQNVTIKLAGAFASITQLYYWKSVLSYKKGDSSTYFVKQSPLQVKSGQLTLFLDVDVVVTLSTVATATKGQRSQPPPSKPFPLPYSDNFQNYQPGSNPLNLVPQVGSFEIVDSPPTVGNGRSIIDNYNVNKQCLMQTVLQQPVDWCKQSQPIAVIGNYNWSDISVSASVLVPSVNSTTGIFVAARIDQGGCGAFQAKGLFLWLFPASNQYAVTNDLAQTKKIKGGSFVYGYDAWVKLTLTLQSGKYTAKIGNQTVANSETLPGSTPSTGFAGLGSENFGLACFANLSISSANSLPAKDDAQLKYKSAEQAAVVPMIRLVEAQRIDNFDHL
ncbi:hypothetical protein BOX15_Mlig000813g1 [Macrostomum lignano]|uniref:galactosylceramidase n=1 Tax=Macrostomum lignano TaxID=282301 RepID=A0A267ENL7_9PLAT|nr:hypothetical protein BOX15_Mlig000813g1 [Macrostomum lignano]